MTHRTLLKALLKGHMEHKGFAEPTQTQIGQVELYLEDELGLSIHLADKFEGAIHAYNVQAMAQGIERWVDTLIK